MLPQDLATNIKRSFNRFVFQMLSAKYYCNFMDPTNRELERRIAQRVSGWWNWIDVHWIVIGQGIFSVSQIQMNCSTIRQPDQATGYAGDELGLALAEMVDEVQEELNIPEIAMYDFSNDPNNPEPVDNVIAPRFRGSRTLPNPAGATVNTEAMSYDLYVWRQSVLP